MRRYANRYKTVLNYKRPSDTVRLPEISNRSTDVYIQYNAAHRLDNIANKYYGYPEYYWVILLANGYSTEFDIIEGDIIRIPYPLEPVVDEIKEKVNE